MPRINFDNMILYNSAYLFHPTVGRLGTAVGAAAALAAASLAVDASGGKLTGQVIPDGATPSRRIYPYES